MIEVAEVEALLNILESDLLEWKEAFTDKDKVQQAICAFSNDLPGHGRPGFVFIGIDDCGQVKQIDVSDQLLLSLSHLRDTGKILPIPHIEVARVMLTNGPIAVIKVYPSDAPPVRFEGRVWIRVGPRRAIATEQEERRLTERRLVGLVAFDRSPCEGASMEDLLIDAFKSDYLPGVVSHEVIMANHCDLREQLASLRLFNVEKQCPTIAGLLLIGRDPLAHCPSAFIQFVRYEGNTLSSAVLDQKMLTGNLITQLRQLSELLPLQLQSSRSSSEGLRHEDTVDYPLIAIRELVNNAVMHRLYEGTNAPIRVYWFAEHIEVQNPGGLFGSVNASNFSRTNDYRNPTIAEGMKSLGYVERFGVGISRAQTALSENGNPPAEFLFEPEYTLVTVRKRI